MLQLMFDEKEYCFEASTNSIINIYKDRVYSLNYTVNFGLY